MSKNTDTENVPKSRRRDLTKMTFRQQNTYAIKMSQNQSKTKDEDEDFISDIILNYDQYFKEKKEKRVNYLFIFLYISSKQ